MITPDNALVRLIGWIAAQFGASFDLGQDWNIDPMSDDELNDQLHYGRDE